MCLKALYKTFPGRVIVPIILGMSMRIVFISLKSQEDMGEEKAATDGTGCTVRIAEVIAMKVPSSDAGKMA